MMESEEPASKLTARGIPERRVVRPTAVLTVPVFRAAVARQARLQPLANSAILSTANARPIASAIVLRLPMKLSIGARSPSIASLGLPDAVEESPTRAPNNDVDPAVFGHFSYPAAAAACCSYQVIKPA
jgi:hypothetical protein